MKAISSIKGETKGIGYSPVDVLVGGNEENTVYIYDTHISTPRNDVCKHDATKIQPG